jgi:hypothetical protein
MDITTRSCSFVQKNVDLSNYDVVVFDLADGGKAHLTDELQDMLIRSVPVSGWPFLMIVCTQAIIVVLVAMVLLVQIPTAGQRNIVDT